MAGEERYVGPAGRYVGMRKVREGREHELSALERRQLKSSIAVMLELRPDATFIKDALEGTFTIEGDLFSFYPTHFGGKTLEEMEGAARLMGRSFGLGFVFNEFGLRLEDGALVSPESESLVFLQFLPVHD